MSSLPESLSGLGVSLPVIAAPMAGGPTTPAMVIAASRASALGFLAAGYKAPAAIAAEIAAVRSARVPFGVNVFAPNPVPVDLAAYKAYAAEMQLEGDRFDLALPAEPREDDDSFRDKIDILLADPVPVVSFTFGIPGADVIGPLRAAGTTVIQTVTSAVEAELAAAAGVDALAVQGANAGGHSGTLTPHQPPEPIALAALISQVADRVRLPLLAAGGLTDANDVAAVLQAGAVGAMVGTVLLLSAESGASATHRSALTDPARAETVITRAFTGRPARGLRNRFIDTYESRAPLGYPAIHHLTSPLRKAAAAAGEPDLVHLWAGTGYRNATAASTTRILTALAASA
jgi:NAD(P)H-dependent flavin oxidoreductase YrpB (nitropropane dioxygenase family)